MLVQSITKRIITGGEFAGMPCMAMMTGGKDEMEIAEVYEQLLKSKLRVVVIVGKLSEEPELKTVIMNLSSKGKYIVFITLASEDITPIRTCKNLKFTLKITQAPNSKKNTINQRSLNVLQTGDDIIINLSKVSEYLEAREYLKGRVITRPTVNFSMNHDFSKEDEVELLRHYFGYKNEDGVPIPGDAEKFVFRSRVARPLTFIYE